MGVRKVVFNEKYGDDGMSLKLFGDAGVEVLEYVGMKDDIGFLDLDALEI